MTTVTTADIAPDPLFALISQYPNCRVTLVAGRSRRRPCVGDRKWTKRRGWLIRRQQVSRYPNGQVQGYCVRRGRPLYEWAAEDSLIPAELRELRWVGEFNGAKDLTRRDAQGSRKLTAQ